ncbi:MAG: phosphoglucomutase/phosphomannomutase family protein [Acidobacteriota bacterium]
MQSDFSHIQFGTDGWRAVIADQYTFDNVRLVTRAIAQAARGFAPPADIDGNALAVSFDRRFLSREFAGLVAEVLREAGYRVLLSPEPTPSQTVSFTARKRKLLGGVMVTASHNPAKYNGLKFKGWYGGSALPEMYGAIASSLGEVPRRAGGTIEETDFLDDYVDAVRQRLDVPKLQSLKILHDPIYGVSSGILDRIVPVTTIRGEVNPSFGGVNPEPIPENLAASREAMEKGTFDLAICNDGDSDRLGILDEGGSFVSPHKILSLLTLYFVRDRGEKGEIVKTFSTTRLIEKIAGRLGVKLHETPIGFKYVADLMLTRNILLGGEESGGLGFGSFMPERDGILSGLTVAECVGFHRRPLSQIIAEMEEEFGTLHYDRRDLNRPQSAIDSLMDRVKDGALDAVAGIPLERREEVDGVKLNFTDGSWLLFRRSGTEPIVRIYCEAPGRDQVESMLNAAVAELDAP